MNVEDFTNTLNGDSSYLDKVKFAVSNFEFLFGLDNGWKSLIINRRKPFTYRVFQNFGDMRVCLHKFDVCEEEESFFHPHPWPGAFFIVKGNYLMNVGRSDNLEDDPHFVYRQIQAPGSSYEIIYPETWHSVTPLGGTVYTLMVNGLPWDQQTNKFARKGHSKTRTTKGKDLDEMSPEDIDAFFIDYKHHWLKLGL